MNSFWKNALSGLLLLLITGLAYRQAPQNELYWDDGPQVLEGKLLERWGQLPTIFSTEVWHNVDLGKRVDQAKVDTYRPLFNASLLLDHQLWGKDAFGFHLTNLLLHLCVVLTAYLFFQHLLSPKIAFLSAALFALHPSASTPVHYVSARADSLATLFGLLFLFFFTAKSCQRGIRLFLPALFLLASFLSKEVGLVFFAVGILALPKISRSKSKAHSLRLLLALVLPLLLFITLRLNALGVGKEISDSKHFIQMWVVFPNVLLGFLKAFFWPIDVMPMKDIFNDFSLYSFSGLTSIAMLFLVSSLLVWHVKRPSWLLWGTLWGMLSLGLVTVATARTGILNSHYFYVPMVATSFVFGWGIQKFFSPPNSKPFYFLVLVFLSVLFFLNQKNNQNFRTEVGFYQAIIRSGSPSIQAVYNLGNAYARKGNWNLAIATYEKAKKTHPLDSSILNNLGVSHLNLGQFKKAEALFEQCVQISPSTHRYWFNLFLARWQQKKHSQSLPALKKALESPEPDPTAQKIKEELCTFRKGPNELKLFCEKP